MLIDASFEVNGNTAIPLLPEGGGFLTEGR